MAVVREAGFHCNSFAAPVCTRLVVFWELFVYERKVLCHNFSKSFDLSDRRALFNLRGGGGGVGEGVGESARTVDFER